MKTLLILTGLLACAAGLPAAQTPAPENLLPEDTMAVFAIPDYARTAHHFSNAPQAALWQDAAMRPFLDHFTAAFQKNVTTPLEKELGIKFSDYTGLAQGQFSLAVTRGTWVPGKTGPESGDPGFLMVMDTGSKSDQLKKILADLKKKWVDSGKQIKTDKIRDAEFVTFIIAGEDVKNLFEKVFPDPSEGWESTDNKPAKKPRKPAAEKDKGKEKVELIVGQSDSLLLVGTNAKDIEKLMIRQTGGAAPALTENAAFGAPDRAMLRNSLFFGWVNLKTLIEAGAAAADNQPNRRGKPDPKAQLEMMGLTGLKSLAFNLKDEGDGGQMVWHLGIPEADRKGLFKILSPAPKDCSPPAFISADIVNFVRYRLDFQRIKEFVDAVTPPPQGQGQPQNPIGDMIKAILNQLGDDVIYYSRKDAAATLEGLGMPPFVLLLGSPSSEQLVSNLQFLLMLGKGNRGQVKEREFLGRKVYTVPAPAPRNKNGKADAPAGDGFSLSSSKEYLALGNNNAMFEEFLRGPGDRKAWRENPRLAEAAQKVGGMNSGLFGFENQKESMKMLFGTLTKNPKAIEDAVSNSPIGGRLGMQDDSKKFKEWLDLSLLPDFSKVEKYFDLSVYAFSSTPEGMAIKFYAPVPPGLRK
ncbi:MAG: hypothetical protein WCO56_06860 [Verrucomicrobiota bacterium]